MDASPNDRSPWKPDLFVVARFLERLWFDEGALPPRWTKAKLQAAVRLNYDLFQKYLAFMAQQGFVSVADGGRGEKLVTLEGAGRDAHDRLVRWIQEVFGESAFGRRPP